MQLTKDEISAKLKEILVEADEKNKELLDEITPESSLTMDLGLTSVGMLYLVILIEQAFSVEFGNVGMDDFKTFGDMVSPLASSAPALSRG